MARSNRGEIAAESAPLLDRQPTRAEVLAELEKLRTGYGISHERVRVEAGALQSLDATADELARRQPATVQREVAAFDVVKCAVEHDIIRTDLHLILKYTLNFVGKDVILTDRVEAVRKLLCVGRDAVERRYAEAYGGLASVLVSHGESPCRERLERTRTAAADMALLLEAVTKSLVEGLAALTIEERPAVREAIAHSVLDHLPLGAAAAREELEEHLRRPTAVDVLRYLVEVLVDLARPGTPDHQRLKDYLWLLLTVPDLKRQQQIMRGRSRGRRGDEVRAFNAYRTELSAMVAALLTREERDGGIDLRSPDLADAGEEAEPESPAADRDRPGATDAGDDDRR